MWVTPIYCNGHSSKEEACPLHLPVCITQKLSHIWGLDHEDTINMNDLILPDVVRYDKIPTANHRHGLAWWIQHPEWHPCCLFHQGNAIKHRNVSSRQSVLAGTIGRWASHWPGVLQGMLRRHCRTQLTRTHILPDTHALNYARIPRARKMMPK